MGKILMLPGDGIGTEVMAEVRRIVDWFGTQRGFDVTIDEDLVGGCAYDAHGQAISDAAMEKAHQSDAVMLGAVGGPQWDGVAYDVRPEAGLLRLRGELGLFANLRPAICFSPLADASSLKRDIIEGLDILIVRELTGGVYFGEPRGIEDLGNGQRRGVNTQVYETYEIERIARVAGDLAMKRDKRLASAEKRNVMESGLLWNEEVTRVIGNEFPELELELSRVFEALELVALIEFGVRVVADGLGLELLEPTNRLRPRRPRGRRRALLLLLAELDDHVRVRRPAREHRGALEVRAPAESNVTASC